MPKKLLRALLLDMAGDWYEYASYGDGTTRLCYKCMKLSFTKEGNEWIVKRDYVLKLFNVTGSSLYAVKQVDNRNFILEGKGWTSNLSMWILGADYDHYLILWSCEEHFFGMYHTGIRYKYYFLFPKAHVFPFYTGVARCSPRTRYCHDFKSEGYLSILFRCTC
ncbi:uncharacterized protein isoform X3 [Rhodnius prolixus]|uniref:uncharacterized protein isoform X3 n=1 Tax=Rhodnius prolixus TaxID=13249 RepID=UPI003D189AF6